MTDALQAQKNKVIKLSDDLQYKMERLLDDMVGNLSDVIDEIYEEEDKPTDDSEKLTMFYDYISENGIPDYIMEKYFNVVEDHIELKNYIKSYLLDVLGMDFEYIDMLDNFYQNEKDLVNDAIKKFLKINQQLILDSLYELENNNFVCLK